MLTVAPDLPLVGRASELGWLEAELRRASAGEIRCILLAGEPGMGKTRICAELLERNRRDKLGLRARAHQSRKAMPLSLWVEALEGHLRSLPADRLEALCGGFLDDLSTAFRSLAAIRGSAPTEEPPAVRLLEGLLVLLDNLSREAPLALLFDDLPMADSTSLEALDYVVRGLRDSRMLILATARPAELDDNLLAAELVTQLEQDGRLQRLRLPPLDHRGLQQLAAEILRSHNPPASLVDWLEARSRGNPLFAIGLLRALLEEGGDLKAPRLRRLPEDLSQRVLLRYRRLGAEARTLIEVLAVNGAAMEFEDLQRLDLMPEERLTESLDHLVRTGFTIEQATGRQIVYEIVHPLVQEAIYRQLGATRRRALHRTVARAFAQLEQPAAAAPHFALSAELGDSEAIDALMTALRKPQHVYREAMVILRSLSDLLPPGDARWLDLLDFLYQHGPLLLVKKDAIDLQTVPRVLSEIERTLEGSMDLRRRGAVQYCLSTYLATDQGDLPAAEAACREALRLFTRAGDVGSSRAAAASLAWIRAASGDLSGQIGTAGEVADVAEKAGDSPTAVFGLILVSFLGCVVGQFAAAEAAALRCLELVRGKGDSAFLSETLALWGSTLAFSGRIAEARSVLDDALAVAPASHFTLTLAMRTEVEWLGGAFSAAVRNGLEGTHSSEGRVARNRASVLPAAAISAGELGLLDEARDILRKATAAYGGRPFWMATWQCNWAEGFLMARAGQAERAVLRLDEAASGLLKVGARSPAAFVLADLAEVAARASMAGVAAQAAARLRSIGVRLRAPLYEAIAGVAASWAALAAGDQAAAAKEAALACGLLVDAGYDALYGRALEVRGLALLESDRARATDVLQQAAEIFSGCQANWRREQVEEALSRLGQRRRRGASGRAGPGALSPRERQVAALAAQAYTAREIGARLGIGMRTVETHLDNAYAKLGIASKAELVRNAAELGLRSHSQTPAG